MYAKDRSTIVDQREMLRIKLKSLAAEAHIIRHEERRSWGEMRDRLSRHRRQQVRWEARATHLAYGFIKGRTLQQMEHNSKDLSPFTAEKVAAMLKKYGPAGCALEKFVPTANLLRQAA